MKGVKIYNCYEVCITGFMRPLLVCAWSFAHAEEKVLSHISKLETKEAHSIVSISFHSSIIN